jgi:cyclophilin family peptidyl-prolyl cis-trans isomerase/HEAT repeat protein
MAAWSGSAGRGACPTRPPARRRSAVVAFVAFVALAAFAAPPSTGAAPAGRGTRVPTPAAVPARTAGAPPAAAPARTAGATPVAAPAPVAVSADTLADAQLTPLQRIAKAEDQRTLAGGVLARYLADPDAALRCRAALAVGRLQDTAGTALLLPLLQDADAGVKREALFALGQIGLAPPAGPGPAVPTWTAPARIAIARLAAPGDTTTADLALEALGKLGDRAATPLVVSLLRAGSTPLLRGAAAVALWRLADPAALGPLLAALDDPDAGVRWRALYALEKLVRPEQVVLLAAMHVDDDDVLVRAYAVRTLGRQKSPQGTAYVLQKLDDPEVGVVVNGIRALSLIADTTCGACLPALVRALDAGDPYVRVTAATALADRFAWVPADSATSRTALDSLAAGLRDPDAATRGACARALLERRGEAGLALVLPLLADSSVYVRVALLQALALLPEAAAAPLLIARLAPGTPVFERATAAEALGTLKPAAAAPGLRAALADTSLLVVAAAAGALAGRGDSAAVPALRRAYAAHAGDAESDARAALLDALRALADSASADSLERAHPAPVARALYDSAFFAAPAARGAVLRTGKGDIEWAFNDAEAPQTVKNFVRLAERGTFDGLCVHRVVPNFVIQDGDPTGTGSGGPGWTIRCEINRLRYEAGMVGMALSGKDTGGSQWFITHAPQPHLNGRYTIFAHVVRGMDVVSRIVQGDRVLGVEILR